MIFIKPYHYLDRLDNMDKDDLKPDYLWENKDFLFFEMGKHAIHFLINKFQLGREDEVCIVTSTGSNYVTTCVSATIFNYCKISRVITDKTKLVYVIHEFGYPYRAIHDLIITCNEKRIPVVEDCAHTVDSYLENNRVGTFGDYAIYSLSKHLPIENCGLLVGNNLDKSSSEFYDFNRSKELQNLCTKFIPYLFSLSAKKKENFNKLQSSLEGLEIIGRMEESMTPHLAVFNTEKAKKLYEVTKNLIEPHPVHVKNWFAISVQPLMKSEELDEIIFTIKKEIDY